MPDMTNANANGHESEIDLFPYCCCLDIENHQPCRFTCTWLDGYQYQGNPSMFWY